jgi:hypothetical protein
MGIELTLTCKRLGAIELLEETGFRLGMPWQHMIVEVSHAQRPPRQRLSSNADVARMNSGFTQNRQFAFPSCHGLETR